MPEREVIARATAREPEDRFPTCLAFVRALEEACARIPPEARALIDGVARLNASGLIAGEASATARSQCFGPFHTAPIDETGEDLALSDGEESAAEFARKVGVRSRSSFKDDSGTIDCRPPSPLPQQSQLFDEQQSIETLNFGAAGLACFRLAQIDRGLPHEHGKTEGLAS